ncbi:hypothetical protein X798_00149 [Onchocerca flexuosa]|uniref:C3H1-type domain-containing protein n=1 Tax=Onchocerca flexuosa TaxID=387005 RepID=A0A238C6E1_9BILA|nr:hypothetical protein X798_00149 [Onchocerca flexuosa]
MLESQDSCYSSCSEESHSPFPRELPDNITKDIAQLSVIDTESNTANRGNEQQQQLLQNIDFATRLGYSMEQLEIVLGKLGISARQDQIFDELIKLRPEFIDRSSKMVKSRLPNKPTTELRSIVVDGSNIAMTYGRKEIFSCRGIRECVQFFRNRGHTDIIVFVPQFRRETARSDCPITDQHILFELENENILVWTPSRRINGRRIVCHDDRYILKTAEEKDAVIVSNDEYRDLIKENPQYRRLVDQRLLMYSFVDGRIFKDFLAYFARFMPPDDPLGKYGPKLAQFLMKGNQQSQSQVCPYARRCTYGNKCKYYHPERPNGIHISVTDRLMEEKQRRQFLSTYTSQPTAISRDHPTIARTQNLDKLISEKMRIQDVMRAKFKFQKLMWIPPNYYQKEMTQPLLPSRPSQLSVSTVQQTTTPFLQNLPLSLDWTHQIRNHHCSSLSNHSLKMMSLKPSLSLTPIIRCNPLARYNRTTIPAVYSPYPYIGLTYPNGIVLSGNELCSNLCNDLSSPQCFIPNSDILNDSSEVQTIKSPHLLTPSTALQRNESKPSLIKSPSKTTYPETVNERHRLQNVLCQLFPKQIVLTVMEAFPDEKDPQKLCPLIIAELQKDHVNA